MSCSTVKRKVSNILPDKWNRIALRFEVLAMVTMKNIIFWDVMPCRSKENVSFVLAWPSFQPWRWRQYKSVLYCFTRTAHKCRWKFMALIHLNSFIILWPVSEFEIYLQVMCWPTQSPCHRVCLVCKVTSPNKNHSDITKCYW